MTDSSVIRSKVAKLRSTLVPSEFGEIPASIPYLDDLLKQAPSLDEKHLLFALILGECTRADNRALELYYTRSQIKSLPLQPVFLTSLAMALAYTPGMQSEALSACAEAVALAKEEDRQVRWSLTLQARIALMFDNYEVLACTIKELIADAGAERLEDTRYEFDFVDQIDVQRFDAGLLARYMELAKPGKTETDHE
jgi:hypothetical protein